MGLPEGRERCLASGFVMKNQPSYRCRVTEAGQTPRGVGCACNGPGAGRMRGITLLECSGDLTAP